MSDKTAASIIGALAGVFAGLGSGSFFIAASVFLGIMAILVGVRSIFNRE